MYGSQPHSNPPQPEWRLPQQQSQQAWQPPAAPPPPPAPASAPSYNPINYGPMSGTATMGAPAPPAPGPGVNTTLWGVRYNQQQQQHQLYSPPPLPVSGFLVSSLNLTVLLSPHTAATSERRRPISRPSSFPDCDNPESQQALASCSV